MTFLTIFTAPKPFLDDHIATIQRNALQSWRQLGPEVSVILLGDDPGIGEAAAEFGFVHIPDVACNDQGVPYIDDMFRRARQRSDAPVLAIVNADIILFPDFLQAARTAQERFDKFVLVGRRWDLDVTEPLDFRSGWEPELKAQIRARGRLQDPTANDYFLFPRTVLTEVPNFTIGRAGWDSWMIYYALHQSWQIMDATRDITVVHQNHDYRHLPGGQPHYKHPESKRNVNLGGGEHHMFDQLDLGYDLIDGQAVRKPLTWLRLVRKFERWVEPKGERRGLRARIFWAVRRYRKGLRYD